MLTMLTTLYCDACLLHTPNKAGRSYGIPVSYKLGICQLCTAQAKNAKK
jgi:hypothetical protein